MSFDTGKIFCSTDVHNIHRESKFCRKKQKCLQFSSLYGCSTASVYIIYIGLKGGCCCLFYGENSANSENNALCFVGHWVRYKIDWGALRILAIVIKSHYTATPFNIAPWNYVRALIIFALQWAFECSSHK